MQGWKQCNQLLTKAERTKSEVVLTLVWKWVQGGIKSMFVIGVNESTWLIWHGSTTLLITSVLRRSDAVQPESLKTCEKGHLLLCLCSLQQPLRTIQRLFSSTDISGYLHSQTQSLRPLLTRLNMTKKWKFNSYQAEQGKEDLWH